MKVLWVGSCSSLILVPLAMALKKKDPLLHIGVLDLFNPSEELTPTDKAPFDEIIYTPSFSAEGSKIERIRKANATMRDQGKSLILEVLKKGPSEATKHAETLVLQEQVKQELIQTASNYDIIQVQYLKLSNLKIIEGMPLQKCILSFWGSDLFQDESEEARQMKIRLFDQCKGITVQNEDMAQIICVKYGWNLKNKIITNRFLANDIIMDQIKNTSKSEARDWFESEFEKVGDKELMVIGYQSKPQTQQLEILEALNSIAIAKKKNLHLVYTFIYGKERTREENILKKSHEAGFTTTVIDRYLTNEEMAKLRCATDIFVHLPESDAFSNTLLEHLYAKNLVITGTWLPYGKHRAFGVCYREVEHPRDLKLEHFEEIEVSQNPERIDRMRYEEDAAGQWLEIYKQLTL